MPLGRVFSLRRRHSRRVMSMSLPDIREDSIVESTSLATITSAFEETGVSSVTVESSVTHPERINRRSYSGVPTPGVCTKIDIV